MQHDWPSTLPTAWSLCPWVSAFVTQDDHSRCKCFSSTSSASALPTPLKWHFLPQDIELHPSNSQTPRLKQGGKQIPHEGAWWARYYWRPSKMHLMPLLVDDMAKDNRDTTRNMHGTYVQICLLSILDLFIFDLKSSNKSTLLFRMQKDWVDWRGVYKDILLQNQSHVCLRPREPFLLAFP